MFTSARACARVILPDSRSSEKRDSSATTSTSVSFALVISALKDSVSGSVVTGVSTSATGSIVVTAASSVSRAARSASVTPASSAVTSFVSS